MDYSCVSYYENLPDCPELFPEEFPEESFDVFESFFGDAMLNYGMADVIGAESQVTASQGHQSHWDLPDTAFDVSGTFSGDSPWDGIFYDLENSCSKPEASQLANPALSSAALPTTLTCPARRTESSTPRLAPQRVDDEPYQAQNETWQDSVIVFSSQPDVKVALKKRKAFEAPRRQEVAMNRLVGACVPCRLRKVSVGALEPAQVETANSRSVLSACRVIFASGELGAYLSAKKYARDSGFSTLDSIASVSPLLKSTLNPH
jgi:hypothetical protein